MLMCVTNIYSPGGKILKPLLFILILAAFSLCSCAGNKSETVLNVTGDNNTITTAQNPTTHKTSETQADVAGSGYGAVTK